MQIEVVRSPRRRKTVQASLVDGVLRIAIPAHLSKSEEDRWVRVMQSRFADRLAATEFDLAGRAGSLAARYGLPAPVHIGWSARQRTLWGSCTVGAGTVRISRRMAPFPRWVLDYVIVHELAHLVEPNHGPRFWEMVGRYEMTERARGYLIAKSDGVGHAAAVDGVDDLDADRA
jgi:hypothetical protein